MVEKGKRRSSCTFSPFSVFIFSPFPSSLKNQFVLARLGGIPIVADYRWVLVILLMSAAIAVTLNGRVESIGVSIAFGVVTSVIFFVSIFLHEFGHAFAAKRERLKVVAIILHPFGGMTQFAAEPSTPQAEFRIAIAGPMVSFALAVVFALAGAAANSVSADILAVLCFTLSVGNLLLAIFNLLPGYPLDGGRVLRAYLWRNGKDTDEATRVSAQFGKIIGFFLMFVGVVIFLFQASLFSGVWAFIVGFFLYDAAKAATHHINLRKSVVAADIMRLPIAAAPDLTIQKFIDEVLPMHRSDVFPVARDGHLYGTLLLKDLKVIDRSEWNNLTISDVMIAIRREHFIELDTPVNIIREVVRTNGIGAVSVVDADGKLVGFLHGPLPA